MSKVKLCEISCVYGKGASAADRAGNTRTNGFICCICLYFFVCELFYCLILFAKCIFYCLNSTV